MLDGAVLVLNRSFLPIHVTSVRRAFTLLYQGVAKGVDERYDTYDFDAWRGLPATDSEHSVGVVGGRIRLPRVIQLGHFDRMPRRHVRFSRTNIYARDLNTCQYCGRRKIRAELNLDHVVPRSQGGRTTWENVVCSCVECNRRKGGRTPRQARMSLSRSPSRPRWTPVTALVPPGQTHPEWGPFLTILDAANRNTELAES